MRHRDNREFDSNINQLVKLLKKIIKNLPANGNQGFSPVSSSQWKDNAINLNLCFITLLPMSAEELDELEELYDEYLSQEERKSGDWSTDLSSSDVDFLKRNGIKF